MSASPHEVNYFCAVIDCWLSAPRSKLFLRLDPTGLLPFASNSGQRTMLWMSLYYSWLLGFSFKQTRIRNEWTSGKYKFQCMPKWQTAICLPCIYRPLLSCTGFFASGTVQETDQSNNTNHCNRDRRLHGLTWLLWKDTVSYWLHYFCLWPWWLLRFTAILRLRL